MLDLTSFSIIVTEEMINQYAYISGDNNPIHVNKETAQSLGFPNKIVHGMLSMGISLKLAESFLHKGAWFKSYQCRFVSPLLVGDELFFSGVVKETEQSTRTVLFVGKSQAGEVILKGSFVVDC